MEKRSDRSGFRGLCWERVGRLSRRMRGVRSVVVLVVGDDDVVAVGGEDITTVAGCYQYHSGYI